MLLKFVSKEPINNISALVEKRHAIIWTNEG